MPEVTANEFTAKVGPLALANRNYSKIFGIGANKTGSTSLEFVFRLYGFDVPNEAMQASVLNKQTRLGNYEPIRRFVEKYDAFQDTPFSTGLTYIIADVLFPNSKFILTERDPELWFDSLYRFHQGQTGVDNLRAMTRDDVKASFQYVYPGFMLEAFEHYLLTYVDGCSNVRWDLLYDRRFYVESYIRRNSDIRKYFHGRPGSLLSIDITKAGDTTQICRFLNIPEHYAIAMPHLNKTN